MAQQPAGTCATACWLSGFWADAIKSRSLDKCVPHCMQCLTGTSNTGTAVIQRARADLNPAVQALLPLVLAIAVVRAHSTVHELSPVVWEDALACTLLPLVKRMACLCALASGSEASEPQHTSPGLPLGF